MSMDTSMRSRPARLPRDRDQRQGRRDPTSRAGTRIQNFFYRCAAIDEIVIDDGTSECRIVLRPSADPTWIEPHLENFRAKINEDRAAVGLAPLVRVRVTAVS